MIPISDTTAHLLIIDDDDRILLLTEKFLQKNGFRVSTATSAAAAREMMRVFQFDVFIVDLMMPEEDGISFTKSLRGLSDKPVLMLTARTEIDDRLAGLSAGADDYITKPFDPRELLLRVKNVLKRSSQGDDEAHDPGGVVNFGDYTFSLSTNTLNLKEETISLTDSEAFAMAALARMPGSVVPREFLSLDGIENTGRAVDVLINRLRKKIEINPSEPLYIQTIRGKGYLLRCDV